MIAVLASVPTLLGYTANWPPVGGEQSAKVRIKDWCCLVQSGYISIASSMFPVCGVMRLKIVAPREAALASRNPTDVEPFFHMFFAMMIKISLTFEILFARGIVTFKG